MTWKIPALAKAQAQNKQVLVSIVTITLNAARDLPLTIESVAGQDFDDFEYLVVDGQSWDNSYQIFARYASEIDRVLEVEDAGVYSAMNYAITECRGRYVLFMNAGDTFYSAEVLSNVFSRLNGEEPDLIHGDHVYVDKSLELHKQSSDFAMTRDMLLHGELSHKWHSRFPCHQATFTKRELFGKVGGYDTRLEICADHDFFLRAFDQGATSRYVDETIAHYFGGGMSAQRGEQCKLEWIKTYRSRSLYPSIVDEFFEAEHFVGYDHQSEATGAKLSGFYPLESPTSGDDFHSKYSWCAAEGFTLISPLNFESSGITLTGKNTVIGQRMTVMNSGATLCEFDVPFGVFSISAPFSFTISPRSTVEVFPARSEILPINQRFVSLRLSSFHFEPMEDFDGTTFTLGNPCSFGLENSQFIKPMLRAGWATPEKSHTWSTGSQSTLMFSVDGQPTLFTVVIGGNPFVADCARGVNILLNGQAVVEKLELSISPTEYIIQLPPGAWRAGSANCITFVPRKTALAPSDPRELGVGLYSIAFE